MKIENMKKANELFRLYNYLKEQLELIEKASYLTVSCREIRNIDYDIDDLSKIDVQQRLGMRVKELEKEIAEL